MEAAKLLKVWVWGRVLYKNTSLVQRLNLVGPQTYFKLNLKFAFSHMSASNIRKPCFWATQTYLFNSQIQYFITSGQQNCVFNKLRSTPLVVVVVVVSICRRYSMTTHRAPKHSKSWASNLICLAVVCLETHNFHAQEADSQLKIDLLWIEIVPI